MKFDYNEYYKILFISSICIIIFSLIFFLINTIILAKNIFSIKFDKKLFYCFVSCIILIFLFTLGFFPFRHGVYLVSEKEYEKIEGFGEINNFKKAYGNNKYVFNGENVFAYYIFIENEKYYIMHKGNLQIGDKVKFEYLPKSRIIISIYEE